MSGDKAVARVRATGKGRFGKMYRFKLRFGRDVPHILFDGIVDKDRPDRAICIRNNGEATFANMDAANDFEDSSTDAAPFTCEGKTLPRVMLDTNLEMAWAEQ